MGKGKGKGTGKGTRPGHSNDVAGVAGAIDRAGLRALLLWPPEDSLLMTLEDFVFMILENSSL